MRERERREGTEREEEGAGRKGQGGRGGSEGAASARMRWLMSASPTLTHSRPAAMAREARNLALQGM